MSASAAVWNGRFGVFAIFFRASDRPEVGEKCVRSGRASQTLRLEPQRLEIGAEVGGEVGPGQGELYRRLEEPELVPGVVAATLELDAVHRAPRPERPEGVGELDFPPAVRLGVGEDRENLRWQHVPA